MGRKYRCVYCQKPLERADLIKHIDRNHMDMVPKEYPVERLVFDICNNKDVGHGHGICNICKGPTEWDDKSGRYKVYCSDKCRSIMRENAVKNMIKVHGKSTLLNDIEHQEKMLAARKISGKYKFTDGGVCTYTGSYEHKLLEFMDKVLHITSDDLVVPGPVIEYDFKGEKKKYITDFFYIPYNLIIEVKDGGDNPNKAVDQSEVREKTHAKEDAIVKLGKYNYLRLTNNNFMQLLDTFIELKEKSIDNDESKTYSINEYCANTPMVGFNGPVQQDVLARPLFITHCFDAEVKRDQYLLSNDVVSPNVMCVNDDGKLEKKPSSEFKSSRCNIYKYVGKKSADILSEVYAAYKNNTLVKENYLAELVTESLILEPDQLKCCALLEEVQLVSDSANSSMTTFLTEAARLKDSNKVVDFAVLDVNLYDIKNAMLENYENIDIREDVNGYFAVNTKTHCRTISVRDFDSISESMINSIVL